MGKYHWHLVAGGGLSGYYIYTDEKVFAKDEIVELLESLEAEIERLQEDYNELIYAVATKHLTESRHETALRYIQEHEKQGRSGKSSK